MNKKTICEVPSLFYNKILSENLITIVCLELFKKLYNNYFNIDSFINSYL